MAQWPLGALIGRSNHSVENDTVFIPLYKAPGGNVVDTAFIQIRSNTYNVLLLRKSLVRNAKEEYYTICYDLPHYKYYQKQGGFFEVFALTKGGSLWVNELDIQDYFLPTPFINDIIKHSVWQVHGYAGYRLRESPNIDSEIIVTLIPTKHVVRKFTGETKGPWAKVIIYETSSPLVDCYSEKEIKKAWTKRVYEGWIKVVDDNMQIKDINYYRCC